MNFSFIWPGKTREEFVKEGIRKYLRGIRTMAKADVLEVKEEKGKNLDSALKLEGERIIKQAEGDYVLLDIKGKTMSSEEFADFIQGRSGWRFVTGGAYGVSEEVREKARSRISFSAMTFPHELMRIILLEQVYRALTIIKGKGYHH